MPEGAAQERLQIRYKPKAHLARVWHEGRFYIADPVPRNRVGVLVDGKPWVSMPLNQNGFTMLTRVTNLAFGISTNIPLALLTSWLLEISVISIANET